MIKLIASDLDGTLLQNGSHELTPRAIRLIRDLSRRGVRFVAASGRQYDNERRIFRELRDEISYIAENGSLCIHRGEVICRGTIPDDLAARIIREVRRESGFEIVVSREDACYIEGKNPDFVDLITKEFKNTTKVVDDISRVDGPILKIAIANVGPQDLKPRLKHLQDLFSGDIKVVTSGTVWIDFIVPGYNKGTALKRLLDLFGISREECIAFGDQYNDVEMLELAGTSYVMENAAPGMEKYGTHRTSSVEDILQELLDNMDNAKSDEASTDQEG